MYTNPKKVVANSATFQTPFLYILWIKKGTILENKHLTSPEIMIFHCLLAIILVLITRLKYKSIIVWKGTPVNYPVTMREVSLACQQTYKGRRLPMYTDRKKIALAKVIPQHQEHIKWAPVNVQITVIWRLLNIVILWPKWHDHIACVGHLVTVRKSNVNRQTNQNTLSLFCVGDIRRPRQGQLTGVKR